MLKEGQAARRESGKPIGGTTQKYGNTPKEKAIIREMQDLRRKGMAYERVADIVNDKGYRTSREKLFRRQTIQRILSH